MSPFGGAIRLAPNAVTRGVCRLRMPALLRRDVFEHEAQPQARCL